MPFTTQNEEENNGKGFSVSPLSDGERKELLNQIFSNLSNLIHNN